jgi:hypothetical protein
MIAGGPALTMHQGVGSAVMSESKLEMAKRHVREGRERVAHQRAILEHLERDGHQEAAREARELLSTLGESLRLAEESLERECEEAGRSD